MPNRLAGSLNTQDPRKGNLGDNSTAYFNPSLFTSEALGQIGDSSRRFFHGPGTNNWNISLIKDLRLTETKRLQFRAEVFNAFNHAQFLSPSGNILSGSFGFVTSAGAARIGQVAAKFYF